MPPRVYRVDASPLKILTTLEQARRALAGGDVAAGRALVGEAVARLEGARTAQDAVLDEAARTPEQRAERVTEPRHPDPEEES
jgi:hypothetical protein